MNHSRLVVSVALLCIYNNSSAIQPQLNAPQSNINTSEQIGNSYFKSMLKAPISQFGGGSESEQVHSTISDSLFYLFFNQLMTNHVFYEVRAYEVYNYISNSSLPQSLVSTSSSGAHQHHLLGYGGVGILGYNINVTPNMAILPSIRVQAFTNNFIVYLDSLGNQIGSNDYGFSMGAKISQRLTEVFAIFGQGFIGYQWSLITGKGVFATQGQATANIYFAGLDFGAPYKMTNALSLTPYMQLIPALINLNKAATQSTSSFGSLSDLVTVYGFKVGYEF